MACKRQEQCKFGKMCGWAEDEETLLTECVEFIEIVPLTNEEWFCGLSTEEKAKVLETIIIKYLLMKQPKCYEITKREFWELWLKEKHDEMS